MEDVLGRMIGLHERCEGSWLAHERCDGAWLAHMKGKRAHGKDRIIEERKREDNLRNLDFTQRLKEQIHSQSWRRRLHISEVLGREPVHFSKKWVQK